MPSLDEGLKTFLACARSPHDAGPRSVIDLRRRVLVVAGDGRDRVLERATRPDDVAVARRRVRPPRRPWSTSPSAAAVVDANAFPTRWPIKHVVFLIKENRTFDNLFGTFPGARGVTFGLDHGVRAAADPRHRPGDARGHPALLRLRARGVERRRDGRVQPERTGRSVGLHAAPQGPAAQLLASGPRTTRCSTTSSPARRGRRSRTTCTRSRRSPAARTTTRVGKPGSRVPHVRVRRAGRAARGGRRLRGSDEDGEAVLRLPHRRRPAEPREDPVGLLRGPGGPEGLHLVGVQRDPPLPREPEALAAAHLPGRPRA